jgi:hypothetical protein
MHVYQADFSRRAARAPRRAPPRSESGDVKQLEHRGKGEVRRFGVRRLDFPDDTGEADMPARCFLARTRVVTERGSIDRVADAVERRRMVDAARVDGT